MWAVYEPPTPYPDPGDYPIAARLEARWPQIQREALQFLEVVHWPRWQPYVQPEGYRGDWDVLPLYGDGRRNEPVLERCPVLAELLASVTHMRQASLSSLSPGTEIKPHRGAPGIVRVHLGLMVEPGTAAWVVNGVERPCEAGKVVVFEDGCFHFAWNRGASHRITLMLDCPAAHLDDREVSALLAEYDRRMEQSRSEIGLRPPR